jgi:hypothetical protein
MAVPAGHSAIIGTRPDRLLAAIHLGSRACPARRHVGLIHSTHARPRRGEPEPVAWRRAGCRVLEGGIRGRDAGAGYEGMAGGWRGAERGGERMRSGVEGGGEGRGGDAEWDGMGWERWTGTVRYCIVQYIDRIARFGRRCRPGGDCVSRRFRGNGSLTTVYCGRRASALRSPRGPPAWPRAGRRVADGLAAAPAPPFVPALFCFRGRRCRPCS